jgi:pyruvate/oxaloacetate carboxyltransferase
MTMRWDFDEIMELAGPRPRDIRRLFEEYDLDPPTFRMIDNWIRREKIPEGTLPVILAMLADKGKIDTVTQVLVRA